MLAVLLSLLCILVLAGACRFVARLDGMWRQCYNPLVLIGGSALLYTLTPWLTGPEAGDPVFRDFLVMQLVAFCGMAAGAIVAHLFFPATPGAYRFVARPRFGETVIVGAQIVGLVLFVLAYSLYLGGLRNIALFGYRNITEADADGSVVRYIQLILIQYALPAVLVSAYLTGVRRTLFYVCTAVYLLLLVASGTRNFLLMFAGNFILLTSVIRRRLSYPKLAVLAGAMLVVLTAVGLYRNFGLEAREDLYALYSAEGLRTLDPSSQELRTSYAVFQIHSAHPTWFALAPGESYLNALLSVIPTFVWPGRPESLSKVFSAYFAMPGEGLGFSNILEAYLNGGLTGVFFINAALLFICVVMYNKTIAEKVTIFGLAFYGNMVFVAFNWNRIDFQTVFKISLIRIALFYLIAAAMMTIVRTAVAPGKPMRPSARGRGTP